MSGDLQLSLSPLPLAPGSSDCSTRSAQPLVCSQGADGPAAVGTSWRCGWCVTRPSRGQETCAVPQAKVRNAFISAQHDCPGQMLWVLQIDRILSAGEPKSQRPGLLKESYCQAKMKPIKQKSLCNGRNEVTAPGTELASDTPEAGQAGKFFCSSILPQFLARTDCVRS